MSCVEATPFYSDLQLRWHTPYIYSCGCILWTLVTILDFGDVSYIKRFCDSQRIQHLWNEKGRKVAKSNECTWILNDGIIVLHKMLEAKINPHGLLKTRVGDFIRYIFAVV